MKPRQNMVLLMLDAALRLTAMSRVTALGGPAGKLEKVSQRPDVAEEVPS